MLENIIEGAGRAGGFGHGEGSSQPARPRNAIRGL